MIERLRGKIARLRSRDGHWIILRYLFRHVFKVTGSSSALPSSVLRWAVSHGHWTILGYLFRLGFKVPAAALENPFTDSGRNQRHSGSSVDAVAGLLSTAKQNLQASLDPELAKRLPEPDSRWETYARWSRTVIPYFRSVKEVDRFAQDEFGHGGFESPIRGKELREITEGNELHLAERFPRFANKFASFTEFQLSDPETCLSLNGRLVSVPMYANMTSFLECITHAAPPASVCEIGGGYGGPCRLWLTNAIHRPGRYVIVDLPESLFFSEVFLRSELGNEKVYYVNIDRPLDASIADKFSVLLCPLSNIAALKNIHFDLVFNTLSMQEMSGAYVDFYMGWLDLQPCHYFFSYNYAVQPIELHPESANKCAPRLSDRWQPVWIDNYSDYAGGASPAMYILAEKKTDETAEDAARRGRALVDAFMSKSCDRVTFLYLLFAARLCGDPLVTCSILIKASEELKYLPREVLVLLELLDGQGSLEALSPEQRGKIDNIRQIMSRQQKAPGKVSPHLQLLWERIQLEHQG